ncbi:tetratricopeptide repeat protein [Microbulbifer discodermiae]|uniref:tetratricopeptide repeat protein n=1 Tax=Microbulbifer sp. 2201CG32-9 TaxID=3232309 RepID=UPI00345C2B88
MGFTSSEYSDGLLAARKAMDKGDYNKAVEILRPLLNMQIAEAQYLYSSCAVEGETGSEADNRSFSYIEMAAKQEYPDALYALGVIYDSGDGVDKDVVKASSLFKTAAEKGHARAKLSYGLDLFYGSNGISKDESLGLSFIKRAVDEDVEGAEEILEKLSAVS